MWAQLLSAILGVWLMAAPAVLGYGGIAAAVDRSIGPLAAGFACVAIWGATRGVRWLNLPLGIALLVMPWGFGYPSIATANSLAAGLLLGALAFVRGTVAERFGGGWSSLFGSGTPNHEAADG